MCREIKRVDCADRRSRNDREGEAREALRNTREDAYLVRPPGTAAAEHQREMRGVAPDPRRSFIRSREVDRFCGRYVANGTHGPDPVRATVSLRVVRPLSPVALKARRGALRYARWSRRFCCSA